MTEPRIQRRWVWDWRLLVFTGVFLPLVLWLGFWQLDRAVEKQAMLDNWEQAPEGVAWSRVSEGEYTTGQPVTLSGQYLGVSWLLDNRTRDGIAGHEILALFRPLQGGAVVINRGWLAGGQQRETLPELPTPDGMVMITARVADYPEPPVLASPDEPDDGGWPRRVQTLPREVASGADPDVPAFILKLEGDHQPGAFRADWEPDMMGPQTHYGYAFQWFSLATALVVLTIIASYRKQES